MRHNHISTFERPFVKDNELIARPFNISNMIETHLELNSRPEVVLVNKGKKTVATIMSTEKVATMTVITSCNTE